MHITVEDRRRFHLSIFLLVLLILALCSCYAPQPKASGGESSFKRTSEPVRETQEFGVRETIENADGTKLVREIQERKTGLPATVTESATAKGPIVEGQGADKAKLGANSAGPNGATVEPTEASWKQIIPPGKEWILLAIGGAALVGGALLAKFAPACGAPVLAGGSVCIAYYFYPQLAVAVGIAAGIWLLYDLWRARQAKVTQTALEVVTRAVDNSPADVKSTVKRKVADTIAVGSKVDKTIQQAKRS